MDQISPWAQAVVHGYDNRKSEREQRISDAHRPGGLARQARMTDAEREANIRVLKSANWMKNSTPEERRRVQRLGGIASMAKKTHEEIAEMGRRGSRSLSPERRRVAGVKAWANMSPEKRASNIARLRAMASMAARIRHERRKARS